MHALPEFTLRRPASLDEAAAEITSSLSLSLTTAMAATDVNGAFTFVAVPPGTYRLCVGSMPVRFSAPSGETWLISMTCPGAPIPNRWSWLIAASVIDFWINADAVPPVCLARCQSWAF